MTFLCLCSCYRWCCPLPIFVHFVSIRLSSTMAMSVSWRVVATYPALGALHASFRQHCSSLLSHDFPFYTFFSFFCSYIFTPFVILISYLNDIAFSRCSVNFMFWHQNSDATFCNILCTNSILPSNHPSVHLALEQFGH